MADRLIPYADHRAEVVRVHGGDGYLLNLTPDRADQLADELHESALHARGQIVADMTAPPQTQSAVDERAAAPERLRIAAEQAALPADDQSGELVQEAVRVAIEKKHNELANAPDVTVRDLVDEELGTLRADVEETPEAKAAREQEAAEIKQRKAEQRRAQKAESDRRRRQKARQAKTPAKPPRGATRPLEETADANPQGDKPKAGTVPPGARVKEEDKKLPEGKPTPARAERSAAKANAPAKPVEQSKAAKRRLAKNDAKSAAIADKAPDQ